MDNDDSEIHRALRTLIDRNKPGERLVLRSENGLPLLYLGTDKRDRPNSFRLMFKRCPEIKPYYPKIRQWLKEQDLEWTDKTFGKTRYLSVSLNPELFIIKRLVLDIEEKVFEFSATSAKSVVPDRLSLALSGYRFIVGQYYAGAGAFISIACLPIYELYRIPYLGAPSWEAVDWTEIFLVGLGLSSFVVFRIVRDKLRERAPTSRAIWLSRFAMLGVILLTAFTY